MFLAGDDDSFYLSGRYRGVGSIMKFYKRNAALRWHAQLDTMTSVDAVAVREDANQGHFFGCGQNNERDRGISANDRTKESDAWFFSMRGNGEIDWIISLRGATLNQDMRLSDSCQGIVFD